MWGVIGVTKKNLIHWANPPLQAKARFTIDQVEHLIPAAIKPLGKMCITAQRNLTNPSGLNMSLAHIYLATF